MKITTWNIESATGYHPTTTFYEDFSIADAFGEKAVRDTYKRAMESWKTDYKYLTELVMALNWKIWAHYENPKTGRLAEVYNELWEKADEHASNHLKGEELSYFFRTTD